MFENFVLASRKNKAQEFLRAIKREIGDWRSDLDRDFLDYMWLAEQSINHKDDGIDVVCAEVVWPMILGNYFITREDSKPVAYASWGFFSQKVSEIKMAATRMLLVREDYNSGNEIWLMDVIAPFGHAKKTIAQLLKKKQELGLGTQRINFRRWHAERNLSRINNAVC